MGARIFGDSNLNAEGKVLPLAQFRLYSDMSEAKMPEENAQRIIAEAEKFLDEEIPFMPLSLYREFFTVGNRANFESRFFKRRTMALTLAMAEYCEGKGRFTDKLADVVWAITEESTWILPAHTVHSPSYPGTSVPEVFGGERLHGIDLFSATTAAAMTAVYKYAGAALEAVSPLITERLVYEIKNRAIRPYINTLFSWTGAYGNRTNNWNPWINSNILYVAAVLEEDTKVRTEVVKRAMSYLDNFTKWYHEDGGCDEGAGYWWHAGGSLWDSLETIYDMTGGEIDALSHPLVRAIGEYVAKVNIHERNFVNFADCHRLIGADGTLLMRYGKRCGSDMLISFGATMRGIVKPTLNPSAPYRSIKNMLTPILTEFPPASAATATFLDGLQVMVLRESSDTGRGMFLAAKGGNNGESHNHNDVGSFIVYHNGRPVLIDAGVGQYTKQTFSPQRYELWFMQSNYHNLPTFDGVGEMQGGNYAAKDVVYDEAAHTLSVNIAGAYPDAAEVKDYVRTMGMTDGIVKITEDVTLLKEKKICFHFMTNTAPVLNKRGEIALAEGRILRYPDTLECEIEEFYSEGLNAKAEWGTENLWRIHLFTTASEFKGEFTVE